MTIKDSSVAALTAKLVDIESVTGNEAAVGNFIYDYCKAAGLQVEKQECTDTRFNVLISLGPETAVENDYGLLFHGHMDTVPAIDMKDPFTARVSDGIIYGRGVVDQKGGLAAAISAVVQLKKQGVKLQKPVCIAAVIDEESEHRGSMKLTEKGIRAEAAVVTEPSGLRAVVGCKGTLPLKLTVAGKAAHGCRPWLGVNAVQKALPLLDELFKLQFDPHTYDDVDSTLNNSINVGLVRAGTAYNNVPDTCEISLDCRISPGETVAGMRTSIEKAITAAKEKEPDLTVSVEVDRPDWNWEPIMKRGLQPSRTPVADPFVQKLKTIHEQELKNELEFYITDGYADMDFLLNDMKIPTVLYGPGNPRLCHTAEEKIAIDELEKAAAVYKALIEHQCGKLSGQELENE